MVSFHYFWISKVGDFILLICPLHYDKLSFSSLMTHNVRGTTILFSRFATTVSPFAHYRCRSRPLQRLMCDIAQTFEGIGDVGLERYFSWGNCSSFSLNKGVHTQNRLWSL